MIKTLKTLAADERESIKPPKTINDVIPISRIWDDGIFLAETGTLHVTVFPISITPSPPKRTGRT